MSNRADGCSSVEIRSKDTYILKLGKTFRLLEKDLQQDEENMDNNLRKNKLQIRSLKQGVEGHNLIAILEELFSGCLGSDSNKVVKINFAYLYSYQDTRKNGTRDTEWD